MAPERVNWCCRRHGACNPKKVARVLNRGGSAMNDTFEKKVRAAAVAGWWVVLIAYAFLFVVWGVYLGLMSARPEWLLTMWGHGEVNWGLVQTVSLWFM